MFVELILLALARLIGTPVNGAYGWISVGPLTIQPAEYLKIIIVWYLAQRFSKQQDEIGIYDFQVLTQNQWIPRAFNDWRFVPLGNDRKFGYFPRFGNATILALVALIMYTVSGIAHRWFIVFIGVLFGVSALSLSAISVIGVDKFSKVPVFGYVAKRFSAYFNPC